MKRKEKMEKLERDRFINNMAQMSAIEQAAPKLQQHTETQPTSTESSSTSNRWAALRGFISQTMDHQPAFRNAKLVAFGGRTMLFIIVNVRDISQIPTNGLK